ncbi:AGAP002439-PA-like protein [Anopheles sinensis]|uniref:AGAP002439-PA-like protein n=1 Tax=Anopheles sinensis TaxID=74873 RepID=A0A084VU60_ANOSI|nr:AGAP002439-PA-like protein [Anopheles sinensis]
MKKQSKNLLLDRMHRGVVYTCMGLTLYGTYMLGVRVYRYFTVIKPARQAEELKMLEAGAAKQVASLDKAPTLTT